MNLLGGRAGNKTLHPYMAAELGARFSLTDALTDGLLPVIVESPDAKSARTAYCGMYLQEEVRAEGLVRQIDGFARFLEAASFSHAGVLNLANIARDCQVGRKTVEGYLGILEDLLLSFRLPVFTRRAQRELAAHPKFFFFDAGLYRTLRPTGPLDKPAEIDGAALEGLVAQHLRAWCDYSNGDHHLHYWQTRSQVEVDFIIYGAGGLYAFEVKNSAAVRPEDLRGLKAFGEDYPEARRLLLYRGSERLMRDGILCLPVSTFLHSLRPDTIPE